jgi:hypothetical protein
MAEILICDNCREEIDVEPIRHGSKVYCCEACAFEAARSADCSGRADSHVSQPPEELDLTDL